MIRHHKFIILITIAVIVVFTSCSTIEKASMHGLNSGYYKFESGDKAQNVYVDVTEEKIDVYHQPEDQNEEVKFLSVPLQTTESLMMSPIRFRKQSLDIDITTILLKYRPSVYGLPPQLNTDLNFALYAGWRYDNFKVVSSIDPIGKCYYKISNLGYDFGFFAGPGSTLISPFTTNNRSTNEYSGMIFQTGVAGFLETNIASFGIAVGFDYLLNGDRDIWIYNNKPWVGFIVGIAFN